MVIRFTLGMKNIKNEDNFQEEKNSIRNFLLLSAK